MAKAEVRENVFVCEYDIIYQRPTKDWGDNCLSKNLANILMPPVPSRGPVCLARWQVLLVDSFQPCSLGSFLTVIWNLANMRMKGQIITVSINYLQEIRGYSVHQTWCAPFSLAHFLKAARSCFKNSNDFILLEMCWFFLQSPLLFFKRPQLWNDQKCLILSSFPLITLRNPSLHSETVFLYSMWQPAFFPNRQIQRSISPLWSTSNSISPNMYHET